MCRNQRGVTVIEIVVSLSILAIAALGLIAVMTRLMMAQSTSSHQTVAKLFAESRLQEAVLASPPDFGAGPSGTVGEVNVRVGQNREEVQFFYRVEPFPVVEPGDPFGKLHPSNFSNMGDIYLIRVNVWWNEEDDPSGAIEQGTRTLEVSRLTYVEE